MHRVSEVVAEASNGAIKKVSPEEIYALHEADCYEKAALAYRKAGLYRDGDGTTLEKKEAEIAR